MEGFSFKESRLGPDELSKQIAEQKVSALHDALDTSGMTPLFELLAKQIIGVLGLV